MAGFLAGLFIRGRDGMLLKQPSKKQAL